MPRPLYQEYLERHSCKVPLVLHQRDLTAVFLKSSSKPGDWRVLRFAFLEKDRHPGCYEVNYSGINHNSFPKGTCFNHLITPDLWYWDQYETQLLKLVKKINKEGYCAVPAGEHFMAAWEAFLVVTDGWWSRRLNASQFKIITNTLDKNLPLQSRLSSVNLARKFIDSAERDLYDLWYHLFFPMTINRNIDWLVRLINEQEAVPTI